MHNQLTENDIKRMKEEIEYRKLVVRKEALEAVKEARAQGDLSENFEYYAAKREKNRNESRIRFLERMIKTAEVISDDSKEDEIGVNNTVELFFEEDGTTETMKIVTTMRGNSLEGLVSTESPIGRALLGHREGDRVYVEVNSSYGYYVVVRSIRKPLTTALIKSGALQPGRCRQAGPRMVYRKRRERSGYENYLYRSTAAFA